MVRAVALLSLLALDCRREQTFDEAMRVLCDLPRTVDAGDAVELAQQAKRLITNREVAEWMSSTTPELREARDARVREMLRRARINDCWLDGS